MPAGASSVQLQVQQLLVNPPANDTCSGAVTLPLGAKVGTNAGAANESTTAAVFGPTPGSEVRYSRTSESVKRRSRRRS